MFLLQSQVDHLTYPVILVLVLLLVEFIIIIIIIYSSRVFNSALADGRSLEFEWQQVSSSLQESSQYSGRSQQCCYLIIIKSGLLAEIR